MATSPILEELKERLEKLAEEDWQENTQQSEKKEAPEHLTLLRCRDCGFKTTVEPDNMTFKSGGMKCPECGEILEPIARYVNEIYR